MDQRIPAIGLKSGLFLGVLGLIAWVSGKPFIFPSLGPTAYLLAFDRDLSHTFRVVAGGHLCGVIGGLIAWHLLAQPYDVMSFSGSFSTAGLYLTGSGVLSLMITWF